MIFIAAIGIFLLFGRIAADAAWAMNPRQAAMSIFTARCKKPNEQTNGGESTTYYVLSDPQGNVMALATADGTLVAQYDYDPYGRFIRETGPKAASCPFRYSSKYRDPDLELYYYGHRWYDAAAMKWLTPDLIGERGGFNLTAFCDGDPINQVDPLGLAPGDGGGNPITLGPGFDFYPVGGWSGGLWEFEHRAVSRLQVSSYALYAVTVKPAFGVVQWIEEHPRVSGAIRAVGGVGQLVLGGTMLYGTGGGGALVGGGTLVANGLDNFVAGAATVVHGEYRRSLLEHGVHCGVEAVGGPEWVGVVLYSGAQVGLPYAATRLSAVQNASKSASAAVLPNTGNRTAQAPTIHGAGALRSALASSGDDVARGVPNEIRALVPYEAWPSNDGFLGGFRKWKHYSQGKSLAG